MLSHIYLNFLFRKLVLSSIHKLRIKLDEENLNGISE